MSELINGKEALIALANGEELQQNISGEWIDIRRDISWRAILGEQYQFRLKPRTITINGIEVPKPFEPVGGDTFYYLSTEDECGYDHKSFVDSHLYFDGDKIQFGAWRTEEEIKQVVAALRSVFGKK